MRPDRRGPGRPFRRDQRPDERTLLPFEPIDDAAVAAVAEMERTLADAGRRARAERGLSERLDPAFAAALRARLVGQLPVASSTTAGPATAAAAGTAASARTVPADIEAGRVGFVPTPPMPDGRPRPVVGRTAWTGPRPAVSSRWAAALVAAVLVAAAVGFGPGRGFFTGPADSRATDVAGASLLRGGTQIALVEGTALQPGDEVRVGPDGHATLVLGGSLARLDGGADVVVRTLDLERIVLDQLGGRVYHRVAVPSGGTYTVATAGITWTAHGTAFDLDRETDTSGATDLTLMAIQHDVVVDGPGVSATILEGRRAEIVLAAAATTPDLSTGAPTFGELHDLWLTANGAADAAAGFDPGILVAVLATEPPATGEPTPAGPTTEPTIGPSASPDGSTGPSPSPTPGETAHPTPRVTQGPTPTARPIADLGLDVQACPGGTIIAWSAAPADGFHHYRTYRSASSSFSGATYVDGSYTTSRGATSGVDLAASGAHWYRTYAYDAAGHVVARSPIREATGLGEPLDLGTLTIAPDGPSTTFSWPDMTTIPDGCSGATKLVYTGDGEPVYGQSNTTLLWDSTDGTVHAVPGQPVPSGTWSFRVQVVYETALGTFVVGQTAPVGYTVP